MLERHVVDFYWSMNREDCSKVLFNLEGVNHGGLAHLVERLLCKQEVIGSSPIISTRKDGPIAQLARAHD